MDRIAVRCRLLSSFLNTDNKLADAAADGDISIVRFLLEYGVNVHDNNDAALRVSALYGHLEIVRLLLRFGANIHASYGSPLSLASKYGHLEVVRLLLDHGATIDNSALRDSAGHGHLEVVRFLLDRGANIHADYDEALQCSAKYGKIEVVRFLLDRGADLHARNDGALQWSVYYGHVEVVKLLIDRGANIGLYCNALLKQVAYKEKEEDLNMMWFLIDLGADIKQIELFRLSLRSLIGILVNIHPKERHVVIKNKAGYPDYDNWNFLKNFGLLRRGYVHSLIELSRMHVLFIFTKYSLGNELSARAIIHFNALVPMFLQWQWQ